MDTTTKRNDITIMNVTYYLEFEYRKRISIESFGVIAHVDKFGYDKDKDRWIELRNVDMKMYFIPFFAEQRAHRWADKLIARCLKYETGFEVYSKH